MPAIESTLRTAGSYRDGGTEIARQACVRTYVLPLRVADAETSLEGTWSGAAEMLACVAGSGAIGKLVEED